MGIYRSHLVSEALENKWNVPYITQSISLTLCKCTKIEYLPGWPPWSCSEHDCRWCGLWPTPSCYPTTCPLAAETKIIHWNSTHINNACLHVKMNPIRFHSCLYETLKSDSHLFRCALHVFRTKLHCQCHQTYCKYNWWFLPNDIRRKLTGQKSFLANI